MLQIELNDYERIRHVYFNIFFVMSLRSNPLQCTDAVRAHGSQVVQFK